MRKRRVSFGSPSPKDLCSKLNPLNGKRTHHPGEDDKLFACDHRFSAVHVAGGKDNGPPGCGHSAIIQVRKKGLAAFKIVVQIAEHGEIPIIEVKAAISMRFVVAVR